MTQPGGYGLPGSLNRVLTDVAAERAAQDAMWGPQEHPDGTGPAYEPEADLAKRAVTDASAEGRPTWRHILHEEVLEAFAEDDADRLRTEPIQVAAVAVKWVQDLDRRAVSPGGPRTVRKMAELIAHDALPLIRRAWSGDAGPITDVFLAARAQMTYLPRLHSDEQTQAWITDVMLPATQVWVAELHGQVVGCVDDAREPGPSGLNESPTCAFPDALAHEVRAAVRVLPKARFSPVGSFRATVGDDRVTIPGRIYNPEVSPERLDGLTPLQRTILHCLYTRHHDGFVRQHHLKQIIGSLEPWVLPYVVHLVGEYVLEIVADIDAALGDLGVPGSPAHLAYSRFLTDNPRLFALMRQRVASYWACYHRGRFPRLADYPGHRLIAAMSAAGAFTTRD
ncbi:hypothetical protein [Microbispora sp. NPDC046933]|uniref:hypothetical protein n=1 Tax=Microbispora sp. NPDC046933 TaxID=3155618 RepID=UPI0033EF6908